MDKIVINGFKSFAESTEFKFRHPFVAIVGPNGSGKTNVADAMRWVMGEQALKLIRIKKSTDAIFAGSTNRGRLGMAQVDLHLSNHDGRLNIDYPEVVITRRITRDGETEYFINKNKSRLQDILMLLAQANFGQKSYGVIGQGMITDILNANPQDRKEFFDEATGVKEFQMKRDQSINKLIRTEQNLVRVEDLLNEIEPRLNSLIRQVKKLEKRKEVEEKLSIIHIQYYGSSLVNINTQLKELSDRFTDVQSQKEITKNKLSVIEEEIDIIGKEESRTELYQRIQNEYSDIIAQKNELLKQQAVLKGRLEVEHERTGEIDLLWMQRRADEIVSRIDSTNTEITTLEQSIQHQEGQLEKVYKSQTEIDESFKELEDKIDAAQKELTKMSEILSVPEIKHRLDELFSDQEQFLRDMLRTSSLDEFKQIKEQAKVITTKLAELLDELHEERDDELTLKQKEINSIQERLQSTTQLKEKLFVDSTELVVAIKSKQEKISLLQQNSASLTKEKNSITNDIKQKQNNATTKEKSSAQLKAIQKEVASFEKQLSGIEEKLALKKASLDQFNQSEEVKKRRLLELQTDARKIQIELNQITNKAQSIEIEVVKLQTKKEDVKEEISREVSAVTQQKIEKWQEVRQDQDQLLIQIERYKHQLELIGGIDPDIVVEHDNTKNRFEFLKKQSTDLRNTIDSLEDIIDELDTTIKIQFNKSFKAIATSFNKYFKLIFEGGEAKLNIVTESDLEKEKSEETPINPTDITNPEETQEDPIIESLGKRKKKQRVITGIDIIAQPKDKKLQSVHALSGGEKSMTAIALICAIIDANTPPFVVLDEVEAALDESNSEKFSTIIKHLSKKTQFIIITHNRATMNKADVLFGVTMAKDGTSHILSVKMTEAEEMLDKE
ncbi:MAG: AAA family ATPase [bacterium]|nr:AAA family ATPase [bacterium]